MVADRQQLEGVMAARSSIPTLFLGAFAALAVARPWQAAPRPPAVAEPVVVAQDTARRRSAVPAEEETRTGRAAASPPRAGSGSALVDEYNAAGRPVPPGACPWHVGVARVLVVVLPDPLDSHLDWAFDSGIESVRRALEHVGFMLDRYWLPWKPASAAGGQDAGDAMGPVRTRVPGAMLFRSRDEPDSLVVVYVVGETPTRGIHSAAFRAALDDRDRVLARARQEPLFAARNGDARCPILRPSANADSAAAPHDTTLRIVGPVFSGSARSLRYALDAWRQSPGRAAAPVSVVSGGATAPSNAVVLRSCPDTGRRATGDAARCASPGISFHATVNPVDLLKRRIEGALQRDLGLQRHEIAYLAEAGTQYGGALGMSTSSSDTSSGGAEVAYTRHQAEHGERSLHAPSDSSLEIPFPMNISRLRREYTRQVSPIDTIVRGQPPSRTRLDWTDPASVSESPEPLSGLTAPTIERTISDIEQTLVLHRIRAVGILATDVRDRLFLASVVKERLRDVKVFMIGSHSLYLRPELNRELRGTLVVSTYPLFLESQFWDRSHAERKRLVFTSDLSEGTYNATLAQLGDSAGMMDYAAPMQRDSAFVAPVWITVVGASSMLPVKAHRDTVSSDPDSTRRAHSYLFPRGPLVARSDVEARPSGVDNAILALAILIAFAIAFRVHMAGSPTRLWREARRSMEMTRTAERRARAAAALADSRVAQKIGRLAADELPRERATLLWHGQSWMLFRSVAVVCAFAPLALVLFRPQVHGSVISRLALLLLAVGMAALWLAVAAYGAVSASTARRAAARPASGGGVLQRGAMVAQHALLHLLALAYLFVTAAFVLRVGTLDLPQAGVFFLRALAVTSGVTPVVPLIVGGVLLYTWCTWHLRRVTLLGDMSAFEASCLADAIDVSVLGPPGRMTANQDEVDSADRDREESTALGSAFQFHSAVASIRRGLVSLVPRRDALALVAALLLLGFWTLAKFDRSIETIALGRLMGWEGAPSSFDVLLRFLIFASLGLSVWTLYRLVFVWWSLRRLLRNVEVMPLGSAFGRMPKPIASLTRLTPFNAPSDSVVNLTIDRVAQARWLQLREIVKNTSSPLAKILPKGDDQTYPALRSIAGEFDPSIAAALVTMHDQLSDAAKHDADMLVDVLEPNDDALVSGKRLETRREQLPLVQDLVALYVVDYVEWVIRHLRHLALGLISALVLTLILLSSYPFEPESLIKVFFFALMAASVVAITSMLFQMSRDLTMSRITHTAPGEVTWDVRLILNLLLVIGIPLLTVIGTELPEVREFLFSWVTPAMRAVGKG